MSASPAATHVVKAERPADRRGVSKTLLNLEQITSSCWPAISMAMTAGVRHKIFRIPYPHPW
jgi:hypothetical protein